jgi:hypothetical protein
VNASVLDPPDPTDAVWVFPSQLLTVEVLQRPVESTLRPGIGVVDQLAAGDGVALLPAGPGGHAQREQDQLGRAGAHRVPAHDALGVDVHDERDVDHRGPGPHVGEVGNPDPVGRWRGEVAVQ